MKKIEIGLWLISIIVIAVASYEFYAAQQQLTAFNWTPVYEPISLNKAASHQYEFTTDKDTDYYMYLDVERTKEFENLQCLIGAAFMKNQCPAGSSRLDLDWQVSHANKVIASGTTTDQGINHMYWTANVGKGIGRFEASAGSRYHVSLTLNQPLPELMVLNPRIKIAMHPREFKQAQVRSNMTGLLTVSLVAFVVLLIAGFYFYKEMKTRQKPAA